jgi:hypothetical protein
MLEDFKVNAMNVWDADIGVKKKALEEQIKR